MTHLLAAALLLSSALQESPEKILLQYRADRMSALVQRVQDPGTPAADRWQAYSELENLDFDRALGLAPSLLRESGSLGFHAAWAMASTGSVEGVRALRGMAKDRNHPLTLPIQALGRLRDPGSHDLLRLLLEDELAKTGPDVSRGRTFALVQSISDYEDEKDAELLTRAVRQSGSTDWLSVFFLGRTGGSAPVLFLREVFTKTGQGWAVTSAGLALARCGDARGTRYVEEQLASAEPARPEDRETNNAMNDDPYGPQARTSLLEHMGSGRDELFTMQLLTIAGDPEQPYHSRALAWTALLRIHSEKYRSNVLDAAWRAANFEGAARLIALDDESKARDFVERDRAGVPRADQAAVDAIRAALRMSERERRTWHELYGYGF